MQGTDQFICDITNAFGRIRLFIEQTDCEVPKDDDLIYGSMILWETVVEVHLNVDVQIVFITNDQGRKTNRIVQLLVPIKVFLGIALKYTSLYGVELMVVNEDFFLYRQTIKSCRI